MLTRFSRLLLIPGWSLLYLERFATGIGEVAVLTLDRLRPCPRLLLQLSLMATVVLEAW